MPRFVASSLPASSLLASSLLASSLPALFALFGCGGNFQPYSHIAALSVLAIKAEPPELAPGETTTLTAEAFDPEGRAITLQWAACLDPPSPTTGDVVNPDCLTTTTADYLLPLGTGISVPFTMPAIDPKTLGTPDVTSGLYLPVRVLISAGDSHITAVYRLRFSLFPPPNQNPRIDEILLLPDGISGSEGGSLSDGEPIDAGRPVSFRTLLHPGSAETYKVITLDQNKQPVVSTQTEELRVSWFSTQGTFTNEHTGEARPDTTLTVAVGTPPGPLELWAAVGDGRGGEDFLHRSLVIR